MPFNNFNNRHFTALEKSEVNAAITATENALQYKLANLLPEERQQYGSVNEQNKLIINKVKDFRDTQPSLSSPDVNWDEFADDHDARLFLETTIQRLQKLTTELDNARILHDYDNYQAAMTDYSFCKYKASTAETGGYADKAKELSQFFTGGNPEANPASSPD